MSRASKTVRKLFSEIDGLSYGPAERALLEQAIAVAEEADDTALAYEARLRLIQSAKMTGDTDAMLSAFAWCAGMNQQDPRTHPFEVGQYDLLWYYKWISATLAASPVFPREDIAAALDQMEEVYRSAGVGMSGVLQSRFWEATISGRQEEAATWHSALLATPRDDYSHCEACVRSEAAAFYYQVGRPEAGLKAFDEIVGEGLSCGEEPEASMSDALLPLLRAGRLDDAREMHLRSYRMAKGNADNIGIISGHLVFCAVTGNESRGLTLLERHLGWIGHDGLNQSAHFTALSAVAVLLGAIARDGHGELPVRGSDEARLVRFFGEHEGPFTVAELETAAWAAAEELGARFDTRNGNDFFASRLAASRALAEEHYAVPIDSDGFVPPLPVVVQEEPQDAAGWLRRVRELGTGFVFAEALDAVQRGLAASPTPRQRADLHGAAIAVLNRTGADPERIERELSARAAAFREDGREEHAALTESLGLLLFGRHEEADRDTLIQAFDAASDPTAKGDVGASLAELMLGMGAPVEAATMAGLSVQLARQAGEPRLEANGLLLQGFALAVSGSLEEGLARFGEALDSEIDLGQRNSILMYRARALAGGGLFEGALADAEAALDAAAAIPARPAVIDAALLSARILGDLERYTEAVGKLRLAIRESELIDGGNTLGLRAALGRELVREGRPQEAVEELDEVLSAYTANGADAASLGFVEFWLGHALLGSEETGGAYQLWTRAVQSLQEGEDFPLAAQAGIALGTLLLRFEDDEAVEVLGAALANARRAPENLGDLTNALHAAGRATIQFGDASGLELLDEALAIGQQAGAAWFVADVTDSKARGLKVLDRSTEAIPLALQAADAYAAAGDTASGAGSELFVAQMLAEEGRHAEAAPLFAALLPKIVDYPHPYAAASLSYGETLEALGRHDEAAAVRARVQ